MRPLLLRTLLPTAVAVMTSVGLVLSAAASPGPSVEATSTAEAAVDVGDARRQCRRLAQAEDAPALLLARCRAAIERVDRLDRLERVDGARHARAVAIGSAPVLFT